MVEGAVSKKLPRPPRNKGLTLIELMVTLAVGVILMTATIPAYTAMTQRSEIASSINAFVSELRFARSEALKRSAPAAAHQGRTV